MAQILLIDDDQDFTAGVAALLETGGHTTHIASSLAEAKEVLQQPAFDLILVDLALPDGSGLELITDEGPKAIIITGHPSMDSAIRAVRGCAVDYLVKPIGKTELLKSVDAAISACENTTASGRHKNPLRVTGIGLIGQSPAITKLIEAINSYSTTDITVLVTGESGTGKELVAEALHACRTPDAPFVALNCGAIPHELIASELFGHEKGSFTGAAGKRKGVFERAGSGTVFLDEIGDLPLQQQVALLRVMETRTIQRVGSEQETSISARIVAATNRNLEQEVAEGRFREDLFYRLNVLTIHTPPLRECNGDIELLTRHFLREYAAEHGTPGEISDEALAALASYSWPGNVRELKHTILRAAIVNRGRPRIDALPADFDRPPGWHDRDGGLEVGLSIRDVERRLIERTLEHFDGNKKMAAEALGVSLKTLYNRLREYEQLSAEH